MSCCNSCNPKGLNIPAMLPLEACPCEPFCLPACPCPPRCDPCCRPKSSCGAPKPITINCCFGDGSANGNGNGGPPRLDAKGCPPKERREKRWRQCNFLKPCIDTRIYRNGEALCISYAGHIPGEQFIHGRNLPTTTTFAKRRLCQYTPYEFVDPDGCCSFCTYP